MVDDCLLKMRTIERGLIEKDRATGQQRYPVRYEYGSELFSIRRKEFFPLFMARSLLQDFIPSLSHESDGLIFQER